MTRHPRDGVLARWVAAIAAADVGTACKMLLLYLVASGRCTARGAVSFPRDDVAHELGIHRQSISQHIREARHAGPLDKRGGGYRGRAAEYVAVIPAKVHAQHAPFNGKGDVSARTITTHLSAARQCQKVSAQHAPNTRALVSATEKRTDAKTHSGNCTICGSPSGNAELCIECYALAVIRQRQESA